MDETSELVEDRHILKSISVGERLKLVRDKFGLSQRELARRADVTNGTLSNIEQGRVSPSISSLEKVLSAVPMSLQEFFSDDIECKPSVYRAHQFVEIHKNNTDYKILPLDERPGGGPYIAYQRYAPGARVTSEWMVHNGTIAGNIISGHLELLLDGMRNELAKGDGFHFSVHRPHAFQNTSSEECVVVCVSFDG